MTCVRSGRCCKIAPCGFGEWDADAKQCKFLEVEAQDENITIYKCGKFEEIQKDWSAQISPAFGTGCCAGLFNEERAKIQRQANGRSIESLIAGIRGG